VDKVADKLAGYLRCRSVDLRSRRRGRIGAKRLTRLKAVVSKVLEKILVKINPALSLLDIALASTPTASEDGIKYSDSLPPAHKEQKDTNNISRPK
jgi:hypothetical protein